WDRLSNVTPDERDRIIDIHQRSLEEIRQSKEREESDIWNLLTEQQKDEYRLIKGKGRLDISTRPVAHPATTPANTQSTKLRLISAHKRTRDPLIAGPSVFEKLLIS